MIGTTEGKPYTVPPEDTKINFLIEANLDDSKTFNEPLMLIDTSSIGLLFEE